MSYNLNSFVNRNEANALKEMIFNRARERSQALNETVQSDVMDVARESFVSKNNPFSQIVQAAEEKALAKENSAKEIKEPTREPRSEIGFPQRELKPRAIEQGRVVQEQMTASVVKNNMEEARSALSNKKSFMGALNFLNSQAAVSLMRTRTDKFEAVI